VQQRSNFRGNEFLCRTDTHECLKTLTVGEVFDACIKILQQSR
jgi:hypothetical protein